MLRKDENDLLCRVGPGSPLTEMMKRYWVPACMSSEVPSPDSAPIRVRLLGEDFVCFRDSSGRVGFFDEACCHRGASLALGRVEDDGIRCLYHGWKFGVDGTIQETPNYADIRFRSKVKAPAYPVRESGGLVWAYLGPQGMEPPFPHYGFMDVPGDHVAIHKVVADCNWLQLLEGGIDSSHLGILHADSAPLRLSSGDTAWDAGAIPGVTIASYATGYGSDGAELAFEDNAPEIEIENAPYGFHYAAIRRPSLDGDSGYRYVRVTSFLMPFANLILTFAAFYIPQDDGRTTWIIVYHDEKNRVDRDELARSFGVGDRDAYVDGHAEFYPENRWRQDRTTLGQSFSGLRGVQQEDTALALSQGRVADRTREHLVPADVAVIRARRMLLDSIRRVQRGQDPAGLMPRTHHQNTEAILPPGTRWQSLIPVEA